MKHIFICSSLYPSDINPQLGLFVEKRIQALKHYYGNDASFHVISPTPYFPFTHSIFGHYADYAKTPLLSHRDGLDIHYIRYIQPPFIGPYFADYSLYRTLKKTLKQRITMGKKPDILIAEYGYPDGFALALLGQAFNIPVLITARGSDISFYWSLDFHKKRLPKLLPFIHQICAVSHDMRDDVIQLGIPENKVCVIGNGVDHDLFHIQKDTDKTSFKHHNNLSPEHKLIISVGGLIDRKGHDLAIKALSHLEEHIQLWIIGEGSQKIDLIMLAQSLGLEKRVQFLGRKTHQEISQYYNNADLLLLCSKSEGRANVLLEAAACGCPLLSSNVQGSAEIITDDFIGHIFDHRNTEFLATDISTMLNKNWDRQKIHESTLSHSWAHCGEHYAGIIDQAITGAL